MTINLGPMVKGHLWKPLTTTTPSMKRVSDYLSAHLSRHFLGLTTYPESAIVVVNVLLLLPIILSGWAIVNERRTVLHSTYSSIEFIRTNNRLWRRTCRKFPRSVSLSQILCTYWQQFSPACICVRILKSSCTNKLPSYSCRVSSIRICTVVGTTVLPCYSSRTGIQYSWQP